MNWYFHGCWKPSGNGAYQFLKTNVKQTRAIANLNDFVFNPLEILDEAFRYSIFFYDT